MNVRRPRSLRVVICYSFLLIASQGIASPMTANAGERPRFLLEWGRKGTNNGEFDFPIGIAINRADEVFVTDFYNSRVQKFSRDGKLLAVIATLPSPGGIAVSRSGDLYLAHFAEKRRAERKTDQVSVYDSS